MQLDPCGDLWCFASLQMTGAFVTGCMLFTLPRGKHCDMSQFFFQFYSSTETDNYARAGYQQARKNSGLWCGR